MNRLSSLLALGAIVVAGAFAGTAAQASANPKIAFNVYNGDAAASMIRTDASANISGISTPVGILPGGYDPASGSASFNGGRALTFVGDHVDGFVQYANANNTSLNVCTFNLRVTRVGLSLYTMHLWISESGTNCTVPADVSNSTGDFSATTYTAVWKT